ncbi:bifunctional adenosylcobinamide kinase/adenosylcobinamide-phosphate guanylyltransferase [Phosphitispora sp. TUW77]|uniref:bifunctional adenosylcobinamide kinase/adenosylcobinamide-phosphate guanylyltransferase n=1 Tax=Phosphitispora sp. TUW77 TaxID=3152361 RepID=UPI003AB4AE93
MRGKLVFVTGGIRSGKSEFAEFITSKLGNKITYIATAEPVDEEMLLRIRLHRQRRPDTWQTIEEAYRITEIIKENGHNSDVIILDCLTLLLSNLMYKKEKESGGDFEKEFQTEILEEISILAKTAAESAAHVVIVSNEIGMTLVSDNFLGRQYQEIVGKANQIVAATADKAYLVVAGHPIDLKKEGAAIYDEY